MMRGHPSLSASFDFFHEKRLLFAENTPERQLEGNVPDVDRDKELTDYLNELKEQNVSAHEELRGAILDFIKNDVSQDENAIRTLREKLDAALLKTNMANVSHAEYVALLNQVPQTPRDMIDFAQKQGLLSAGDVYDVLKNAPQQQETQQNGFRAAAAGNGQYVGSANRGPGITPHETYRKPPTGNESLEKMSDSELAQKLAEASQRFRSYNEARVDMGRRYRSVPMRLRKQSKGQLAGEIAMLRSQAGNPQMDYMMLNKEYQRRTGMPYGMMRQIAERNDYDASHQLVKVIDQRTGGVIAMYDETNGTYSGNASKYRMSHDTVMDVIRGGGGIQTTPNMREIVVDADSLGFRGRFSDEQAGRKPQVNLEEDPLLLEAYRQKSNPILKRRLSLRRIARSEGVAGYTPTQSEARFHMASQESNPYSMNRNYAVMPSRPVEEGQFSEQPIAQSHIERMGGARYMQAQDRLRNSYIPELMQFVEGNLDLYKDDPAYPQLKNAYERAKNSHWQNNPDRIYGDLASMRSQIEAMQMRHAVKSADEKLLDEYRDPTTKELHELSSLTVAPPNGESFSPDESIVIRIPAKQIGAKRDKEIVYRPFTEMGVKNAEDSDLLRRLGVVIEKQYADLSVYHHASHHNRPRVTGLTIHFLAPIDLYVSGRPVHVGERDKTQSVVENLTPQMQAASAETPPTPVTEIDRYPEPQVPQPTHTEPMASIVKNKPSEKPRTREQVVKIADELMAQLRERFKKELDDRVRNVAYAAAPESALEPANIMMRVYMKDDSAITLVLLPKENGRIDVSSIAKTVDGRSAKVPKIRKENASIEDLVSITKENMENPRERIEKATEELQRIRLHFERNPSTVKDVTEAAGAVESISANDFKSAPDLQPIILDDIEALISANDRDTDDMKQAKKILHEKMDDLLQSLSK